MTNLKSSDCDELKRNVARQTGGTWESSGAVAASSTRVPPPPLRAGTVKFLSLSFKTGGNSLYKQTNCLRSEICKCESSESLSEFFGTEIGMFGGHFSGEKEEGQSLPVGEVLRDSKNLETLLKVYFTLREA